MMPFIQLKSSQAAPQWGWPTHHLIAEEAIEYLDTDWQVLFNSLISLVKGGSILPDTWHDIGDTPNHLYYPEDPSETTGPQAIERWYNYYVANLSSGNYPEAILAGAIMGHYWADLNIPVHTDEYWPGHSAYESDINYYLSEFTIGSITLDSNISDIQQYAIDAAIHAHQYYDDIRNVYPDGNQTDAVVNNVTIKAITEEQLTRAIAGLASLWRKGIGDSLAPIIETKITQKALIDGSHGNDYEIQDQLKNLMSYLSSLGFEVVVNEDIISAADLEDVNFLIVTAFGTNFAIEELNAITNWLDSGRKSVFITGRGDFTLSINHSAINELLSAIGTVIRMNDDNIYTVPDDPYYYDEKDWYIDTENVQAPQGKSFLDVAQVFQLFSPNSLYFAAQSNDLQILVNGSQYHYQYDESAPGITVVWDDTDDGSGGERIPLVALERLSDDDDRIIVFGDTSFSDFSFAPHFVHDNEHFIPVLIEWVLFDNVDTGLTYVPRIEISTTTTDFLSPVTIDFKVSSNAVQVSLLVNGSIEENDSIKPFNSFNIDLAEGSYNITIKALNSAGQSSCDSLMITVKLSETTKTTTETTTEKSTSSSRTSPWSLLPNIAALISSYVLWRKKNKNSQ